MKVLVTVGTTRFDLLVKYADMLTGSEYDVLVQTSDTEYVCGFVRCRSYIENIEKFYKNADVVVTHAGAGSVYKLLEMGKKIIVVPNLERIDKHQYDLARYVCDNGYALVLWDVSKLETALKDVRCFSPKKYSPDPFFKYDEIIREVFLSCKGI